MEVIIGIVCLLVGVLCGIFLDTKFKKSSGNMVGTLLVDQVDPIVNGGVYSFFSIDPHSFKDKEIVQMEVMLITEKNSQEEQG